MRSFSPFAVLALLLLAAAGILIGGSRVARREVNVRVAADRGPMRAVAEKMGAQLASLDQLYEADLRQLTAIGLDDPANIDQHSLWQRCQRIDGVSQWSLIWNTPSLMSPDIHVPIDPREGSQLPQPAFEAVIGRPSYLQILLSAKEIPGPHGAGLGWIDEPGKPLLYWQARPGGAVVLLIDPDAVRASLEPWFKRWAAGGMQPLEGAHASFALLGPDGRRVAAVGATQVGEPDYMLPVRSRFGTWQLAAWDPLVTRLRYDEPIQAAAAALAVLVALLGVFGFVQQRRTLALAAQRVSFVNRVSHELRTPLTNIMLNLDLATEGMGDESPEAARRLGLVREEVGRLARLIENVLTFSRAGDRPRAREARACVPSGIIAAVVEQFSASFARRGFTVQCTGEPSSACLIDADAFAQILANLLSNVEKYVPGGVVEIASALEQGTLSVTISDQGPGIAPGEAERIFRPFERLDSRINEGATGTGLGLAIARDLAESAGGSLTLVPSLRGASFRLTLPAPHAPGLEAISAA